MNTYYILAYLSLFSLTNVEKNRNCHPRGACVRQEAVLLLKRYVKELMSRKAQGCSLQAEKRRRQFDGFSMSPARDE
jgi:hypothetical protein